MSAEYQKVDELETRELVHQQYPGVKENHHKITLDYKHLLAHQAPAFKC